MILCILSASQLVTLIFVVILFGSCLAYSSKWPQQPYNDDKFNVKANYLSDTALDCNDTGIERSSGPVPGNLEVGSICRYSIS